MSKHKIAVNAEELSHIILHKVFCKEGDLLRTYEAGVELLKQFKIIRREK
jgi:hypothetical protein